MSQFLQNPLRKSSVPEWAQCMMNIKHQHTASMDIELMADGKHLDEGGCDIGEVRVLPYLKDL